MSKKISLTAYVHGRSKYGSGDKAATRRLNEQVCSIICEHGSIEEVHRSSRSFGEGANVHIFYAELPSKAIARKVAGRVLKCVAEFDAHGLREAHNGDVYFRIDGNQYKPRVRLPSELDHLCEKLFNG